MKAAYKRIPYAIEPITADNHRPGMPDAGFVVFYRPHESFGWTGCRSFAERDAAEKFASELAENGDSRPALVEGEPGWTGAVMGSVSKGMTVGHVMEQFLTELNK